jgi:hypothetical protein
MKKLTLAVRLLFRLEANTLSRLPDTKSHKNIDK